jgi:hypothetical protein
VTDEGAPAGYTPVGLEAGNGDFDNTDEQASVNASNVTIVNRASGAVYGAWAHSAASGDVGEIQLANSIVRGFPTAFRKDVSNGGTVLLSAFDTDYDGANTGANLARQTSADPHFVDPSSGDYRLRWDSPLIDYATPWPSATTDLDGNPRAVTAHGDSSKNGDLGAYEYQHRAPVAAAAAGAAHAGPGVDFAFSGAGSADPDDGDTLNYAWAFDDGAHVAGQDVQHAFITPGQHSATLTVTDPTGLTDARSIDVTVDAPGTPNPPGAPGGTPKLSLTGKPKVSGTSIVFTVACTVGPCSVSSTAQATELMRGGRVVGLGKTKLRRKKLTVASNKVTIATGKKRTVKLSLGRKGRGLLARYGKLPVGVTVKLAQPGAKAKTVKTAKLTVRAKRKKS